MEKSARSRKFAEKLLRSFSIVRRDVILKKTCANSVKILKKTGMEIAFQALSA
jgi:hypothetical protein